MSAEIIQFPGLLERVARRLVPVMEAPPGDQREDVFFQVTTELGVGLNDGLDLSAEQWALVWHRVDQLMTEGKRASG